MWNFILLALHIAVCLVLILVVLLQTGKRADLAGAFGGGGSQTAFGARGAATFLSKATTWSAVIFMATSVILGVRFGTESGGSVVREPSGRSTPVGPAPAPALPQPVPVQPQPVPVAPQPVPVQPPPGAPAPGGNGKTPPPAQKPAQPAKTPARQQAPQGSPK